MPLRVVFCFKFKLGEIRKKFKWGGESCWAALGIEGEINPGGGENC